jgi:hypothetical protein
MARQLSVEPLKEHQVRGSSGADSRPEVPGPGRATRLFVAIGLFALASTIGAMWAASRATPIARFSVARSADPGARYAGDGDAGFAKQVVRGKMPEVAGIPLRYIVALAHFEGDPDHQVENRVRRELESLDPAFGVKVVDCEHTWSSQPTKEEVQTARACMAGAAAKVLICGSIRGAGDKNVIETTIVNDAREPFDRVYSPPDFQLPEIPFEQQLEVLRLAIAVGSSEFFANYGYYNFRSVSPLTAKVEHIADSSAARTWSSDALARVNFVAARGFETSNHSRDFRRAIVDYLWSLNEWRQNPLGSAMVL